MSSSSWFTSLKESAAAVASSAVKATEQVVSQVQATAASSMMEGTTTTGAAEDVFQKLTLTSPELRLERERIDAEERRKESVRDKLSGLLPWETRDPERDILVEECKQVILALSSDPHTFTGPYEMPEPQPRTGSSNTHHNVDLPSSKSEESNDGTNNDNQNGQDDQGNRSPPSDPTGAAGAAAGRMAASKPTPKPTAEALERLRKLEPLPNLLGVDFDLDSHVGLIKRLLKLDPILVKAQSSLSGGGERERVFWHNYFFHCAYSRYEAGLSVDEVWSEVDVQQRNEADAAALQLQQQENNQTKTQMIQTVMQSVAGAVAALHITTTTTNDTSSSTQDITTGGDLEQEISFEEEDTGTAACANKLAKDKDEMQAVLEQQQQLSSSNLFLDASSSTTLAQKSSSPTLSSDYDMLEESNNIHNENAVGDTTMDNHNINNKKKATDMDDQDLGGDYEDPELDELEAEIARELED